jgi:hypothetical protein
MKKPKIKRNDKIKMNFAVKRDFYKKMKYRAIDEGSTMTALLYKAVNEYTNKKKPLV